MIIVAVTAALLAVLLVADRVAVRHAQDGLATRLAAQGFAAQTHVRITGFPFLTQLAARRMDTVIVSATGKRLGLIEVKSLDATLRKVSVDPGSNSSTAAQLSGTVLIGFAGIAGIAGTPGLTVSAGGPGQVKITIGLGWITGTATARVTRAGPGGIRIAVISASGIPMAALGPLHDLTLPLPGLPSGVTVQGVTVNGQGLLVHIAGQNVTFTG